MGLEQPITTSRRNTKASRSNGSWLIKANQTWSLPPRTTASRPRAGQFTQSTCISEVATGASSRTTCSLTPPVHLFLNNGTTVIRGTRGRVFLQPIDPDGKVATFTQASVARTIMAGNSSLKPPRLLATAALTTGTAPMPRTRKEVITQTSTVATSEDKQTWTLQS